MANKKIRLTEFAVLSLLFHHNAVIKLVATYKTPLRRYAVTPVPIS